MSNARDGVKVDLKHRGAFSRRRLIASVDGTYLGEVVTVEPNTIENDTMGWVTIRVLMGNCRFTEADES